MKHAYLILAHNRFDVLRLLVDCLDDERNDIFIHFDRKVKDVPEVVASKSRLYVLKNRVNVSWGGSSMVEAEERLFKAAVGKGPYSYYHLLSGVDLPIKSQDHIHAFFKENEGKEFIGFAQYGTKEMIESRMRRIHLFQSSFRYNDGIKSAIRFRFLSLQDRLGFRRSGRIPFYKGAQWVSVTDDMAKLFVSSRPWIKRVFSLTLLPDESVFQTLCVKAGFQDRLFSFTDEDLGEQRLVNWDRKKGIVRDWSYLDLDVLKTSDLLFARKFNGSDPDFLKAVKELSMKRSGDEDR